MGASTVIKIKDGSSVVCFYGHNEAPFVLRRLHEAMSRRLRWDDAPYLGRIIWDSFCPIAGGELGYGIGGRAVMNQDGSYVVVVDVLAQQITVHQVNVVYHVYTFFQFCALNVDAQTGFGWAIRRAT